MIEIELSKLTPAELAVARSLASASPPGRYTLKQLYGRKRWLNVLSPTGFGERFSASYCAGELPKLARDGKKSAAWVYVIGKSQRAQYIP